MRLHLNENTAGCSPAVLQALRALGRPDAGFYPDYDDARVAVARNFAVPADHVLLTNGLDEGILAAIGAALRERSAMVPETLGVAPAFDMYEVFTTALGGGMRTVPLNADFDVDPGAIERAVTPATRIVFLTNPHNPSGRSYPLDIFRAVAAAIAPVTARTDAARGPAVQPERLGGGRASSGDRRSRLPRLVLRASRGVADASYGNVREAGSEDVAELRELHPG